MDARSGGRRLHLTRRSDTDHAFADDASAMPVIQTRLEPSEGAHGDRELCARPPEFRIICSACGIADRGGATGDRAPPGKFLEPTGLPVGSGRHLGGATPLVAPPRLSHPGEKPDPLLRRTLCYLCWADDTWLIVVEERVRTRVHSEIASKSRGAKGRIGFSTPKVPTETQRPRLLACRPWRESHSQER